MTHLRRLAAPLSVLLLLISTTALVTAPAAAQSGVRVFVLVNDMVDDEDREEQWQMRVTIRSAGACNPTAGVAEYSSSWLNAGSQVGVDLSLDECIFEISAVMRQAGLRTDCWFTAQLSWDLPGGTTPADNSVFTTSAPEGVSRLSVVRKPRSSCAFPTETRFFISATDVVEQLPVPSADADLLALARRAAAVSTFDVRITPDYPSGSVPAGCDDTATLTIRGDGRRVDQPLDVVGGGCRFRASIVGAPAAFDVVEQATRSFADSDRIIDLSSLVRLPHARIAIVQDVQGSADGGAVSYAINRSCGDTDVDPAGAGKARSVLYTGRYTVHSPTAPDFGPAVTYPAVAAAADSDDVVGCSVSVAIGDVPADCVVDGALTRTLTWTEANPVSNFDFEFDITCGAVQVTTTTTTEPVTEDPADEDPDGTVAVAGDEVRIVARKLSNGKIEFGLQQQQSDDSWGDRLRPTRRFFPAPARAGRWLQSSPVALAVAAAPEDFSEDVSVRIVARRLSDDRVEFGLQQRADDGTWDEPLLPARRFFPADTAVGRWLVSSPQNVSAE